MALWVDKHRPKSLSTLDYHKEQAESLKQIVQSGDFPHFLFHGPSGAGKKTRIMCMLRELYGPGIERLRIEHKSFQAPSGKRLEISSIASNYHVEINPSDVGIYDRVVVQELIKTMAQTNQLDASAQKSFKVVLLTEADRLSRDAQNGLRRTMEKYAATCRIILCCQSTSKISAPLRSRCQAVRVAAPSVDEIVGILQKIAKKEGLHMPTELASRIALKSDRNLRRAVLSAEVCRVEQIPLTPDQKINELDWEVFLKETARKIVEEQTPRRLLEVRTRLYELLSHCIPTEVIFRVLLQELASYSNMQLKAELVSMAAEYEHRMQLGAKPIFHLEAFVAKFMSLYKRNIDVVMADFQ